MLKKIYSLFLTSGVEPFSLICLPYNLLLFLFSLFKFSLRRPSSLFKSYESIPIKGLYPVINEHSQRVGSSGVQYFIQDILVARDIVNKSPGLHVDIGSRVDAFVGHLLSSNIEVLVGDVRPVAFSIDRLSTFQFDLTRETGFCGNSSKFDSVSCLHAIEHMGLGRYGDKMDMEGHIKALINLRDLLAKDGTLYLSHPFSSVLRVEFNAHRVFTLSYMKSLFDSLDLVVIDFKFICDLGLIHRVLPGEIDYEFSYRQDYGCALWQLRRSD